MADMGRTHMAPIRLSRIRLYQIARIAEMIIVEREIDHILIQNSSSFEFQDACRSAYQLLRNGYVKKVNRIFVHAMKRHLRRIVRILRDLPESIFLKGLNRQWTLYSQSLLRIQDILFHPGYNTGFEYYSMGAKIWSKRLMMTTKIECRLNAALMGLVLREHMGELVPGSDLMSKITTMLEGLGLHAYDKRFEKCLLDATEAVHRFKSQIYPELELGDRAQYLRMAKNSPKLAEVVNKEMICDHMLRLVEMVVADLGPMLVEDKYEDLARTYMFFESVPGGLVIVCTAMSTQLRATGEYPVTDFEDHVGFVQRLLDQKDKYDKVIRLSFKNDMAFQNAMFTDIEYLLNRNKWAAISISLYIDHKAANINGVNGRDAQENFDKLMVLIRNLQYKNMFKKDYRMLLAKRLLSYTTVSYDTERSQISKLTAEFGFDHFTSTLERMLTDMEISKEIMEDFISSQISDGESVKESNLHVSVLTSASWPNQPAETCNLPEEILSLRHRFQTYYYSAHSGRRLTWQPNISTAEIKADFGYGKEHDLIVSTYQMCILMLFNTKDFLTYGEIQQRTGIRSFNLKEELRILACVKGKNVLRKEPMTKGTINETDVFIFNDKFSSKICRINIWNVAAPKVRDYKRTYSRGKVDVDRRPQIDTAIVRVMKSRGVLDHKNLIVQVIERLKSWFVPNPPAIKKQIEALIEKEYMERDKDDIQLYRYLA